MSRVTFTIDDDGGVTVLVYPFLLPNALALRSACEYISISSPLSLSLSLSLEFHIARRLSKRKVDA